MIDVPLILAVLLRIGVYALLLATLGILLSILYCKNSSGISAKSQVLRALIDVMYHIQTLRILFMGLESYEYLGLHIAFTVIAYFTLLYLFVFRRTYQKEHDKARIEFLMIPCVVIANLVAYYSRKSSVSDSAFERYFSMPVSYFARYLDVVALVPQFQFVISTKKIRPCVLFLIIAEGSYLIIDTVNKLWNWIYWYHIEEWTFIDPVEWVFIATIVAPTLVKLLIHCSFYVLTIRALGICCYRKKYHRVQVATSEHRAENGISNIGHLSSKVDTVELVPHPHSRFQSSQHQ